MRMLGVLVSIQTSAQSFSVFFFAKMDEELLPRRVENKAYSPLPSGGGLSNLQLKLLSCLGLPPG